jgi:hypothetical protein
MLIRFFSSTRFPAIYSGVLTVAFALTVDGTAAMQFPDASGKVTQEWPGAEP